MNPNIKIAPLLSFIEQYVNIHFSIDELNLLKEIIPVQEYRKGTVLLKENEISTKFFFKY